MIILEYIDGLANQDPLGPALADDVHLGAVCRRGRVMLER